MAIIIAIALVLISIVVQVIYPKYKELNVQQYFGGDFQQKLLFYPSADTKPKEYKIICEPALFRYVLNEETKKQLVEAIGDVMLKMLGDLSDIDKKSKITEFEIHKSSMETEKYIKISGAYHVYIVFETINDKEQKVYWSLEKGVDYIYLQRSSNKSDVKDKFGGEGRKEVEPIEEKLVGKGTMKDLLAIIWAHQVIVEKYNIFNSNCQTLVTLVSERITENGYKYKGKSNFSPPETDRHAEMLDLINLLTNAFDNQHSLLPVIYYENTNLFEKIMKSGDYDIDEAITPQGLTPLHLAIMFSKTKMVRHLLGERPSTRGFRQLLARLLKFFKPPVTRIANPNKSSNLGMNALHYASSLKTNNSMEIIDLLLKQKNVNINERDEKCGRTALHYAVGASNVTAVKHLIGKRANLNISATKGGSLLHYAAYYGKGTEIIDLIVKAKTNEGIDSVDDNVGTPLHVAAISSNEIIAEYLINKGANVNHRDKRDRTPLHVAAMWAKNMKIIDLLLTHIKEEDIDQYKNDGQILNRARLNNNHRLEKEIIDRLRDKFQMQVASLDEDKIVIEDIRSLHLRIAFMDSDVEKIRDIIKEGLDISTVSWGYGRNALHCATFEAKNTEVIDVILETGQVDIDGGDEDGQTPLHYAMLNSDMITARYLIEKKGADPTVRDKNGSTLFHLAATLVVDIEFLNLLLSNKKKININERNNDGMTALHFAIFQSNVPTARYLIEKGANLNVADKGGRTPLHMAALWAKDMNTVELLLNHKDVDVNCLDNSGRNALQYAKRNKHDLAETIAIRLKEIDAVRKALEKQKSNFRLKVIKDHQMGDILRDDGIPFQNKIEKMLPRLLIAAITNSDVEKVVDLIEKGLDIGTLTWEEGENALHLASIYAKTTELIDVILENGQFNIDKGDIKGRTPLHYAMMNSNVITARYLIEKKGADPTVRDKNGTTPFHVAATLIKDTNILDLLLSNEKKININERNNDGMTALHFAIINSNVTTTHYLIEKEANLNVADEGGRTPLHVAALCAKDMEIVNLLLKHIDVNINCLDNDGRKVSQYARNNENNSLGGTIANRLKEKVKVETEIAIV